jgi:hypothetical protein
MIADLHSASIESTYHVLSVTPICKPSPVVNLFLTVRKEIKECLATTLVNHISFHQFTSGFFVLLASQVSVHVQFIDFEGSQETISLMDFTSNN